MRFFAASPVSSFYQLAHQATQNSTSVRPDQNSPTFSNHAAALPSIGTVGFLAKVFLSRLPGLTPMLAGLKGTGDNRYHTGGLGAATSKWILFARPRGEIIFPPVHAATDNARLFNQTSNLCGPDSLQVSPWINFVSRSERRDDVIKFTKDLSLSSNSERRINSLIRCSCFFSFFLNWRTIKRNK